MLYFRLIFSFWFYNCNHIWILSFGFWQGLYKETGYIERDYIRAELILRKNRAAKGIQAGGTRCVKTRARALLPRGSYQPSIVAHVKQGLSF